MEKRMQIQGSKRGGKRSTGLVGCKKKKNKKYIIISPCLGKGAKHKFPL